MQCLVRTGLSNSGKFAETALISKELKIQLILEYIWVTVAQDHIFRLPPNDPYQQQYQEVFNQTKSHKSRQHKNINGHIREAVAERWSKLSIGLQCYLGTSLALGLVEASGLLH